jgi:hypothetical protein
MADLEKTLKKKKKKHTHDILFSVLKQMYSRLGKHHHTFYIQNFLFLMHTRGHGHFTYFGFCLTGTNL